MYLLRWGLRLLVLLLIAPACLLLNNNFCLRRVRREAFAARLDTAAELGMTWIAANRTSLYSGGNPALFYMINDMAQMSGDHRAGETVGAFLQATPKTYFWRPLISATEPELGLAPSERELERCDYCRWMAYSIAPRQFALSPTELSNMFSADRYSWGSRTHQLLSLLIYRQRNGESDELNRLINHLCEAIAREESWDVRVSDLYLQRVALLLEAGRPDLVKRRWVERILANQQPDGGWLEAWHGWGPGIFQFGNAQELTTPHPTVQAVWLLYLLKYQYPRWKNSASSQRPLGAAACLKSEWRRRRLVRAPKD